MELDSYSNHVVVFIRSVRGYNKCISKNAAKLKSCDESCITIRFGISDSLQECEQIDQLLKHSFP